MSITFTIPIRTVSPNRVRGLTRGAALAHAARKKKERNTAKLCMLAAYRSAAWRWGYDLGKTITLTRVAPRPMDGDNAIASMKACRDGVAEALGANDNDPRIAWVYSQRRGGVREHFVEVSIE